MAKTVYKIYQTKSVLNTHKHSDGAWFWEKYSAFPYIGCEWGCEYCYWRDEKHNPHKASRDPDVLKFDDAFSQYIKIKENAPELLKKALSKKPVDVIYLDNYQPIDAKYQYARKLLEVCLELNFPVFINEKSPTLIRDIDILKKIKAKTYLNVGWSIITVKDDKTRLIFEPKAPPVLARFEAMKKLAGNGIFTGTIFMPILPYIYGSEENIEAVVKKTKECGGKYVLEGGLTLWGYSKTHFYKALKRYEPDLIEKYEKLYNDPKLFLEYMARIHKQVLKYCQKYGILSYIPRPVDFYPKELQLNKKIAEKFYFEARELQVSGNGGFKEWTYRKAAWAIDDLKESLEKIYEERGIEGIMEIKIIGEKLAKKILCFVLG